MPSARLAIVKCPQPGNPWGAGLSLGRRKLSNIIDLDCSIHSKHPVLLSYCTSKVQQMLDLAGQMLRFVQLLFLTA